MTRRLALARRKEADLMGLRQVFLTFYLLDLLSNPSASPSHTLGLLSLSFKPELGGISLTGSLDCLPQWPLSAAVAKNRFNASQRHLVRSIGTREGLTGLCWPSSDHVHPDSSPTGSLQAGSSHSARREI